MEDGIRQASFALADALGRGDPVAAAALYVDDGKLLTPAAELIAGRRQIEAYWQAGLAFGLSAVGLHAIEFEVANATAIEIGRYVLALDTKGAAPTADRGKYLVLHRREQDGSWRRAVEVFNPDVPQPARRQNKEAK